MISIILNFLAFVSLTIAQDCLYAHNEYRSLHGVPPLRASRQLEKFAAMRAEQLAKTDVFEHPKNMPYGENLYWRRGPIPTCQDAADTWYKEIKLYNWMFPHFTRKTGHFTQLVWASSTEIGCASAQSYKTKKVYIVCNYSPHGNVRSQFKKNVLPPQTRR